MKGTVTCVITWCLMNTLTSVLKFNLSTSVLPSQGMWLPSRAWAWGSAPSLSHHKTLWTRGSRVSSSTSGVLWLNVQWVCRPPRQVSQRHLNFEQCSCDLFSMHVRYSHLLFWSKAGQLVTKIAPCPGTTSLVWLLLPWRQSVPLSWEPCPPIPSVQRCNIFSRMKMIDNLCTLNRSCLTQKAVWR